LNGPRHSGKAREGEQVPDFNLGAIFNSFGGRDANNPSKSLKSQFLGGLENIGLNFTAGLATVGLGGIAVKAGLNPSIASPQNIAYNTRVLTSPPGSATGLSTSLGPNSSVIIVGGAIVVGLIALAVFSRRARS
jgi:hypothetical protein